MISQRKDSISYTSKNSNETKFKVIQRSDSTNLKNSEIDIGDDAHENLPLNWENAKNVMKIAWWYIANLFLIYLFQYL